MATKHTASSVVLTLDGHQQRFIFENEDGEPIPHDDGELVVKLDGEPLRFRDDYMLSRAGEKTIVSLLQKFPRGHELAIERFTEITQPRRFNRTGGASLKEVENGLDRITRALQDAVRRIAGVERVVQVEHRVVELAAEQQEVDPAFVAVLQEQLTQNQGMSEVDALELATIISTIVVQEFKALNDDLARRVAALEAALGRIAQVTGEDL